MAEDSDLERTEEPTGRRIEQAREQGQIPHSRELSTFLVLIVGATTLWVMGQWLVQRSAGLTRQALAVDYQSAHEPTQMLVHLGDTFSGMLLSFAPVFGALLLAALLGPFFLNAWVFAPKSFMPDLTRLSPLAGFGRMFSWNSLVELVKAILKASIIGGVAVALIWSERDDIFALLAQPLPAGMASAGHLVSVSFLLLVAALALIVLVDVPFQIWQYFDKLKMSKEEVRQEMKEMQGDPQVKGRIRSLQMQAARRRMMAAVPQADVIVTNPTHFAIALAYKTGMKAPKVLAKGMGEIALRIRELGAQHAIPLVEAPPLARALYRHSELDRDIPVALYTAVAEVLAYVYQLAQWRQQGGQYPTLSGDLQVPPELVPEAN